MPRKKQHCPKRMKWEGGEGGGGGSPSGQSSSGNRDLETNSSSSEEQSQDEEEEEAAPPINKSDVEEETEDKEGKKEELEEEKVEKEENVDKGEEGERMLGPEALIQRDPSSPRGATVVSPTPTPSPSPPQIPQIRPQILLPPIHTAGILGPSVGSILTPNSTLMTPTGAVITGAPLGPTPGPPRTPEILDFSTKGRKRSRRKDESDEMESDDDLSSESGSVEEEGGVLNLSKGTTQPVPALDPSSPLDLTINRRKRQRISIEEVNTALNIPINPQNTSPLASLTSSIASHLLPVRRPPQGGNERFKAPPTPWASSPNAGTSVPFPFYPQKPSQHLQGLTGPSQQGTNTSPDPWNGKVVTKPAGYCLTTSVAPSDATKALEKMSELSKLGSERVTEDPVAQLYPRQPTGGSVSSRQSAWQSHWLSKGADQARDVLKCVWCRQSFQSLSQLTLHMKEAKHCQQTTVTAAMTTTQPTHVSNSSVQSSSSTIPAVSSVSNSSGGSGSSGNPAGAQGNKDLSLLIKETMPLPRKLVRGQDVWLGKGAEQTRQILKCMWCGQSFRSLAEMTSHMQQTQHYTNIVSQEQIISWKSADERSGSGSSSSNNTSNTTSTPTTNTSSQGGHVTAVLTCKVCEEAFGSLKELSNHMVKNQHYKEHIMRSITDSGGCNSANRRRGGTGTGGSASVLASREKRKKSLPVRKLLELERAQNELKNGSEGKMVNLNVLTGGGGGRITCEKCGERIDTSLFVEHIRQCVGGSVAGLSQQRNLLKTALMTENQDAGNYTGPRGESSPLPPPTRSIAKLQTGEKADTGKTESPQAGTASGSSPSVLNAIEKLIEKSFDSRMRQYSTGHTGNISAGVQPIGSSILKRLGIDESVDYTKPLVDQHTMNLLRGYHAYGQFGGLLTSPGQPGSSPGQPGSSPVLPGSSPVLPGSSPGQPGSSGKRERSGSESSSVSERCGQKSVTPRSTPEALGSSPVDTPVANTSSTPPPSSQPPTPVPDRKEDEETAENAEKAEENAEKLQEAEDVEEVDTNQEDKTGEEAVADEPKPAGDEGQDGVQHQEAENPAEKTPKPEEKPKSEAEVEDVVKDDPKNLEEPEMEEKPPNESPKPAGSLGALSVMFDSLSGDSGTPSGSSGAALTAKTSSHPLAALQKLCDKTESHHNQHQAHQRSPSVGSSSTTSPSNQGTILAFSWACNDAVVSDSVLKCAFCETPFVTKGAYRHHLSKIHFVKDGVAPDGAGSSQDGPQGVVNEVVSPKSVPAASTSPVVSPTPPGASNSSEESPHSKFLKYTELAKQLSSKYV